MRCIGISGWGIGRRFEYPSQAPGFDKEGVTFTPEAFQQLARGREAYPGSGVQMDPYPGGV